MEFCRYCKLAFLPDEKHPAGLHSDCALELMRWCDEYLAANPVTPDLEDTVRIKKLRLEIEALEPR